VIGSAGQTARVSATARRSESLKSVVSLFESSSREKSKGTGMPADDGMDENLGGAGSIA